MIKYQGMHDILYAGTGFLKYRSIRSIEGGDRMAESKQKNRQSVTKRTLYYYGRATLRHWPFFLLDILSSTGYAYFLTFGNPLIIARIVDRISTSHVSADQVFAVFGPDILLLILCNVLGQVSSKLQDYSLWKRSLPPRRAGRQSFCCSRPHKGLPLLL